MSKLSALLSISGVQFKVKPKYHNIPVIIAIMSKQKYNRYSKEQRERELSYIVRNDEAMSLMYM